jgi:hypothetical protein
VIESASLMYCYVDDCHYMIFVLLIHDVHIFLNVGLIVCLFVCFFLSFFLPLFQIIKAIMMRTEVSYLLAIFVCWSVD